MESEARVTCKIESPKSMSLAMENLCRAWMSPAVRAGGSDGKLNWFDGPPVVARVVALEPRIKTAKRRQRWIRYSTLIVMSERWGSYLAVLAR